jgi:hypothetical protein
MPLTAPAPAGLDDMNDERYNTGSVLLTSNRTPAVRP